METAKVKEILGKQLEILAKDSDERTGLELAAVSSTMLQIASWLVDRQEG